MAKGDPTQANTGVGFFPSIYQSALGQSAEDYDSIMSQYRNLADETRNRSAASNSSNRLNFSPITPNFVSEAQGPDLSALQDIARTGGFSDNDINSIRERSISPIRSIYSSASRNLNRQKSLAGGYAPNAGAISAKLARDASSIIGDKTNAANANIAEMVQRGKLAGTTALSQAELSEAARRQSIDNLNAEIANRFNMFNTEGKQEADKYNISTEISSDNNDFNKILESIKGQQGTYATTPAWLNTIGSQVLSAGNLVNNFPPIQRGSLRQSSPNNWSFQWA